MGDTYRAIPNRTIGALYCPIIKPDTSMIKRPVYIVGERDSELFVPTRPGVIYHRSDLEDD